MAFAPEAEPLASLGRSQSYAPTSSAGADLNPAPLMTQNIMNRRAGTDSSLYQICINLKRRLTVVPGFHEHMAEMDEEEALEGDFIDPVTSMWNCLRRGYPLMTVYNALRPKKRLEVDRSRYGEAKIGKAATFQFLQACLNELKIPSNETFLITDLYGEDTTGFVKVTKCVNKVLDVLQQRGLLLQRRNTVNVNRDPGIPQSMTHRQKIVEEFVKTERDYVQHLETLQQFKDELDARGAIAGDAAHDIFLNLNALLDFQRRFLIRIEQQNSLAEIQQDWGKLLHYYRESFRVYEPFIANQQRCRETVERHWDKLSTTPIRADLKDLVDTPATLLGFLLKPFQRLTKYPLLLRELRDKGGLDEQRRINLDDGINAAESILHRANDAIHRDQRHRAVADLQQRVEDWKGHKIDHFGDLLLHGNYTVLKGEGSKEVEREYKVYLFERILLCCKEIDLNKPKNKILGGKNPHLDKKGQPKLQLKGRIFMQNVTEILTFKKPSSYTLQIFWKGDPGIENFVIRFNDEKTMLLWENTVLQQKQLLLETVRRISQGTSSTEFVSMETQPRPENPYREIEDEDDDVYAKPAAALHSARLAPSESRNASNNSLRSAHGPRYAPVEPPLSLVTDVAATDPAANSYFSPSNDSPLSDRSSSQASMYGFPRQPLPPAGWSYDHSKHRTAPAMARVPSRDGTGIQAARPSLPVMMSSQQVHSQFAQNRSRSASTPDINGPGQRRPHSNSVAADGVPVPPVPSQIMRNPLSRSQTASPFDLQLPSRSAKHGRPVESDSIRSNTLDFHPRGTPPDFSRHEQTRHIAQQAMTSSFSDTYTPTASFASTNTDRSAICPAQLKVKVMFDPGPSHVTIVVPSSIKYKTLVDRIDSKMVRVAPASIARGSARLRYRDQDDDFIVIKNDEDVADAIEEWATAHETNLQEGIVDDFELFWQDRSRDHG